MGQSLLDRLVPPHKTWLAALLPSLLALVVVGGCATISGPPQDLDQRIQTATNAFGSGFDYLVVHGGNGFTSQAFVTLSKVSKSDLARDLATRIAPAENQAVRFMVTGESAEKTSRVILDGLYFHRGRQLPYLEFLYLGDATYEPAIRKAVEALGAQFRFEPYPRS